MEELKEKKKMSKKTKTTLWWMIGIVSAIFVFYLIFPKGSGDSTADVKNQKQTQQTKNPEIAPENRLESDYGMSKEGDDEIYAGNSARPTGVYKNGIKGFNFNVNEKDLVDKPTGDWGVTKSGLYFCKKDRIEKKNLRNPVPIRIGGYMTLDKKLDTWRFKPVVEQNVDGVVYYTYQSPSGPVAINGNILFCFWYDNTNKFYPYEDVKDGNLQIASEKPL